MLRMVIYEQHIIENNEGMIMPLGYSNSNSYSSNYICIVLLTMAIQVTVLIN